VLIERSAVEGWALAEDDSVTVAVTTALDDELAREARVLDRIHEVNGMRKDAGLALTDRIVLTLPGADADLAPYADQLRDETLATEIRFDGEGPEPHIERA
jgi:isoleucyl-tRNA synthetase